jgi:hypothetical protein
MPQTILIEGETFEHVTEQRGGARVYRSGEKYLRIGSPEVIDADIATHRRMVRSGYPVAPLISNGTYEGEAYFVEQSLGDKTFRVLFEEAIREHGAISEELFAEFMRITERYLKAQIKTTVPNDPSDFARGIHLDILREELPQYTISLKDKFERILQKVSGFPFVLSHGDYNPANIYPLGVIDLEDSFSAPLGFDVVSGLSTNEWFPDSPEFEFYAHYRFTDLQKETYLAMCDSISRSAGYPPISAYYADFAFCRAMWSTVRMQEFPKLQAWRYDKFIKTYLYN